MQNTDGTKSLIYIITDVSYNTVDTIHMIQLQLSTLVVIYTNTLSTNVHEYISSYTKTRLLQKMWKVFIAQTATQSRKSTTWNNSGLTRVLHSKENNTRVSLIQTRLLMHRSNNNQYQIDDSHRNLVYPTSR